MNSTHATIIRKGIMHARFEVAAANQSSQAYKIAWNGTQSTFAKLGTTHQKDLFIKAYSRSLKKLV